VRRLAMDYLFLVQVGRLILAFTASD